MKDNFSRRVVYFPLIIIAVLAVALAAGSTDIERASQGLSDYSIRIITPDSSPAYGPVAKVAEQQDLDMSEVITFEAVVTPVPGTLGEIYWTSEGPSNPWLFGNYGAKVLFYPTEIGVYSITAIFKKDGKETKTEGVINVINVEIKKPLGSYDEGKEPYGVGEQPNGSFIIDQFRWDFQGVVSGCIGSYTIHIDGSIIPVEGYNYQWSLDGSDIYNDQTGDIDPPSTPGEVVLTLKAFTSEMIDTKVKDDRHLYIYEDHLQRDIVNFNNKTNVNTIIQGHQLHTVSCHQSVAHAYNGTMPRNPASWFFEHDPWVKGLPHLYIYSEFLKWYQSNKNSPQKLERGDVIAIYNCNSYDCLSHSQTVFDGDRVWSANNAPGNIYAFSEPGASSIPESNRYIQVYRKP